MTDLPITPWDKADAWGQPWHGSMDSTGLFLSDSGIYMPGVRPPANDANPNSIDVFRRHTLVKFSGLPAVVMTPEEESLGYQYNDYAILCGPTRQYSPISSAYRFGEMSWLYRTPGQGACTWVLVAIKNATQMVIRGRRVDYVDDAWQIICAIDVGDAEIADVWSSPTGESCIVDVFMPASEGANFVELSVAGGDDVTPPFCSAAVRNVKNRSVSDDGQTKSHEELLGHRYLPNGDYVEIWRGVSITYSGPLYDSGESWFYVGSTRYNVGRATRVLGLSGFAFDITDFSGATRRVVGNPSYKLDVELLGSGGVFGSVSWVADKNSGAGYGISATRRGIIGMELVCVGSTTSGPVDALRQNYVEHPMTGVFKEANWVW